VFLSAPGPAISALFCENLPSHSKRFYVTPTTTRHAKSLDALKKKMKKKLLLVEKVAKQRYSLQSHPNLPTGTGGAFKFRTLPLSASWR
jgi:hypothetical protein